MLGISVVPVISGSAVGADSASSAAYGADAVKAVQRTPSYPSCSPGPPTTYDPMTVRLAQSPYSDSARAQVDISSVVSGGAYLRMFASGDSSEPWGIAMYQNTTDLEVRWSGTSSSWVLPSASGYGTARRFTEKGQAFGLYSGGFLHDSSVEHYGNFFLIGQTWPTGTWPSGDTLTYTPDAAQNDCTGTGFYVASAKTSAMAGPVVITGADSATVVAPATAVGTLTGNVAVTWSISSSRDSALFQVSASGAVSFTSAPTPGTYAVTVVATNSSATSNSKTISVTVPVPPTITGASAVAVTVPATAVQTLTASMAVSWSITGGTDAALFQVGAATGAVSFSGASTAGTYVVIVTATDAAIAGNVSTKTITVTASSGSGSGGGTGGFSGSGSSSSSASSSSSSSAASAPSTATPAVSTTSVLTPINSSDNGNLPEGGLAQGGSLLLVNGQTSPVSVVPDGTKPSTGLVATGEGWWLRLSGRSRADIPLGLTASGALILQSPQARTRAKSVQPVAQASGRGLKASSEVRFYILPETLIGALSTNDAGALQGDVPMPAGMAPGTYTLQMNALTPSGDVRSLSIGVLVRAAGNRERIVSSTARVLFPKASAMLAPAEKADLRLLARTIGSSAVSVEAWGYVQKSDSPANDKSLSKSRARAVASFLRLLGVRGKYTVRGFGAGGSNVKDRKVVLTVKHIKR